MNVNVKKLHPDAVIPKYAKAGDSGFDLVAIEDIIIQPGETKIVLTGLAFEIPVGYEMQVRPRSGVSRKTKLRVILGTIDAGYRGEVGVIVENVAQGTVLVDGIIRTLEGTEIPYKEYVEAGTYRIRKGDRIAQGVVSPVLSVDFTEVEELPDSERGQDGFGSTGVKV